GQAARWASGRHRLRPRRPRLPATATPAAARAAAGQAHARRARGHAAPLRRPRARGARDPGAADAARAGRKRSCPRRAPRCPDGRDRRRHGRPPGRRRAAAPRPAERRRRARARARVAAADGRAACRRARARRPDAARLPHDRRRRDRARRRRNRRGAAMSPVAPEAVIWDVLRGGLTTRGLAIAADLGIADALAAGPRSVEEVARDAGADVNALHRVLRALSSDGIFAEESPGVFRNTDASELLRGEGWRDFAHLFGGVWLEAVGVLNADGEAAFPRLHTADFWTWLGREPAERAAFDRAMEQGVEDRLER